jgi:hypothetical protein
MNKVSVWGARNAPSRWGNGERTNLDKDGLGGGDGSVESTIRVSKCPLEISKHPEEPASFVLEYKSVLDSPSTLAAEVSLSWTTTLAHVVKVLGLAFDFHSLRVGDEVVRGSVLSAQTQVLLPLDPAESIVRS